MKKSPKLLQAETEGKRRPRLHRDPAHPALPKREAGAIAGPDKLLNLPIRRIVLTALRVTYRKGHLRAFHGTLRPLQLLARFVISRYAIKEKKAQQIVRLW